MIGYDNAVERVAAALDAHASRMFESYALALGERDDPLIESKLAAYEVQLDLFLAEAIEQVKVEMMNFLLEGKMNGACPLEQHAEL